MTDIDQVLSAFESVNVVQVRARDVLLFRSPGRLSDAQRASAAAMLDEVFPDHESIVLEGGQDIAVLRPEPGLFRRMLRPFRSVARGV
jgi:hypothetical protein